LPPVEPLNKVKTGTWCAAKRLFVRYFLVNKGCSTKVGVFVVRQRGKRVGLVAESLLKQASAIPFY
jgi:hypothetical protein